MVKRITAEQQIKYYQLVNEGYPKSEAYRKATGYSGKNATARAREMEAREDYQSVSMELDAQRGKLIAQTATLLDNNMVTAVKEAQKILNDSRDGLTKEQASAIKMKLDAIKMHYDLYGKAAESTAKGDKPLDRSASYL